METGCWKGTRKIVKVRRPSATSAPTFNPFAGIRLVPPSEADADPSQVAIDARPASDARIPDEANKEFDRSAGDKKSDVKEDDKHRVHRHHHHCDQQSHQDVHCGRRQKEKHNLHDGAAEEDERLVSEEVEEEPGGEHHDEDDERDQVPEEAEEEDQEDDDGVVHAEVGGVVAEARELVVETVGEGEGAEVEHELPWSGRKIDEGLGIEKKFGEDESCKEREKGEEKKTGKKMAK
ncbi:hypothetical protein ACLB2K_002693 [Fragaria x ananassa]